MEIFYTPEKYKNLSIALGFFDGIHQGHKQVIENAVSYAKNNNLKSAVVSFVEHPKTFLLHRKPLYILSTDDKIKFLENIGVDYLYLLNFDEKLANMSKEDYFEFLCSFTEPKSITTGFNHFFAKNKSGDTNFLKSVCKNNNIEYTKVSPVIVENKVVSSSVIRNALCNGDIQLANKMLGYCFYLKGIVVKGEQLGRKLGYKTININYPENIISLPYGVYYTITEIDGKENKSLTNWGVKPTISDNNKPGIETYIFNYANDVYGKNAKISFISKIRDEKKFDTYEDLKSQIQKDIEFCLNYEKN